MARVVRSDGTVEHGWDVVDVPTAPGRITVRKWCEEHVDWMFKSPSRELFDAWQAGSNAKRTADIEGVST